MTPWDILRQMGAPVKTAATPDKWALFNQVTTVLSMLEAASSRGLSQLVAARAKASDLPDGRVWQESVKRFLGSTAETLEEVDTLKYRLEDLEVPNYKVLSQVVEALNVPRKATVAYAISDMEFSDDKNGETNISYSYAVLKTWVDSLGNWAKAARVTVNKNRHLLDT